MNMFLRPKESLRLSLYSLRRCVGFSNSKDFHLTQCAYLRNASASRRKAVEARDYESSPSVSGEFSVIAPLKNVNDNFFGIESDEGVIEINNKASSRNDATRRVFKSSEQEKLITTSFGTVRYDSENKPKYHGQLEREKVLINSNIEKDKIRNLNETLLKKNSLENHSESVGTEKSSKPTTDELNKNYESKLASSSYVDELYFPESYTKEGNISKLEGPLSSSNDDKRNIIEESYFSDKITSEAMVKNANITSGNIFSSDKIHLSDQEKSADRITDESSSFQSSVLISSSFIESKSNFIEESYFSDKKADESIFKNVNTSNNVISIDKNNLFVNERPTKHVANDRQSSFSPRDVKSSPEITQETKTNMEILYNLNESIEEIDADDGEKLSLEYNNLSLEDLGVYNKFVSNATVLPKKKNNFLFQSKEFLKNNEMQNSKGLSRMKKLRSFQKNLFETDTTEESQNEKEMIKSPPESLNSKAQKNKNLKASEQPETAYDFVKKLRSAKKLDTEIINGKFIQKNEQYDSKGFRILRNQVPNLSNYTRDEILELLVKNVLYSDDDLIVLNKPYNLVIHESKTVKDPCLSQYLDDLAAELDKKTYRPKLITVHRIDKETCGCLLLARNEISAQRLLSNFSQRKIIKTYWIVTTKVPNPLEGVIDIPISEGSINSRARMVLHPDLPKDIPYQNHSKSGKRAVTHYKVIAESGNAALVEVRPETGIKHQIRVHFGFGLSCPILGDHKYSHLDKLAPQKLQSDLLQRLHVRQSKVRHIPMHIYARSIFIPQYNDGKNLFVMAPMPMHMSKNLQKLKFRKK